jgi:hypothetical protein
MAEQPQLLSGMLPMESPMREKLRQADVLIADLENTPGYAGQATSYRNNLLSQLQLGMQAKSPNEVRSIAANIENMIGGLKSLAKTSLAEAKPPEEAYSVLSQEQESQLGLSPQLTYQRKGEKGKIEPVDTRNIETPEEKFRLGRLVSADQTISDIKKEAESFLNISPELNRLDQLLDAGTKTGKFQNLILPLKQFGSDLGIEVKDVASQEEFRSTSSQLALTFGQKLKGSMSDGDRTLLIDRIAPNVGNTEDGNKMIIAFYKAGVEKNKMIRNAIRDGYKKNLNPYEIQEKIDEIKDQDIIVEKLTKQFPQLQSQGQSATQPPTIKVSPDAEAAMQRARELRAKQQ